MSYNYEIQIANLFNEKGILNIIKTWELIKSFDTSVFTMQDAMRFGTDSWDMLAVVDYLERQGLIRELSIGECAGQHRIFRINKEGVQNMIK